MSDQATSRVLRYPNPQGVVLAAAIAEADRFCLSEPTGILLLRQAGLQDAFTHGEPISITRTATAYRLSDPDTGILLAELAASLTPEERKQIIDNWRRENRIDSVGLTDGGIILPLAGLIAGVLILLLLAMLLRFRLWRARAWAEMTRSSLARSEARFSTAFENTGLPVMVLREGRIYRINDAARQLLGYHDAAELIGRQPAEISPRSSPTVALPPIWARKFLRR
ncbi:PAS domain S-box protein [Gemmobacter lanyuensis]